MSTFRFAIAGTGNIASTYFSAIAKLPDMDIVGIVSRSPERAATLAAAHDGLPVADSFAALPVDYDGVILATPNGTHHALAEAAAALGKHVLTEKSIDITPAAADRMIHACEAAGVTLAVTYQRRCSPDNQAVRRLLQSGAFGRVLAADLAVKFYRPQAYYDSAPYRGTRAIDGGGPFMQQASHNIDILCWFFGLPVEVQAMLSCLGHSGIDVEDHGAALLRYADGMIATLTASTIARPGFPARFEINTERGSLSLVNDVLVDWQMDGIPKPCSEADFVVHSGSASAAVSDTAGHEAILRDFVDAIHQGRLPIAHAASARLSTDLIDRLYRVSGFYPA